MDKTTKDILEELLADVENLDGIMVIGAHKTGYKICKMSPMKVEDICHCKCVVDSQVFKMIEKLAKEALN